MINAIQMLLILPLITIQINEDLQRMSGALACTRFTGEHTFVRIAELLESVISTYGISLECVTSTVTDNGSNFVKAFKGKFQ